MGIVCFLEDTEFPATEFMEVNGYTVHMIRDSEDPATNVSAHTLVGDDYAVKARFDNGSGLWKLVSDTTPPREVSLPPAYRKPVPPENLRKQRGVQ